MKSLGGAETFPVRPDSILAHQGGWDEVLLVAGPLAVVGLALWVANRRVSAQLGRKTDETGGDDQDNDRDNDRDNSPR